MSGGGGGGGYDEYWEERREEPEFRINRRVFVMNPSCTCPCARVGESSRHWQS